MASAYKFGELIKDFSIKNLYRFFGENENSATIIACSIAIFKGIFRPMFTMMDKESDPETKKYAAIREGLTEVAAFPIYAVIPSLCGKLVEKFSKETDIYAKKRMKTNAKFIGICAATLIIPAICNVIQPPIMKAYKKHQDAKKSLDIASKEQSVVKPSNPVKSFSGRLLTNTNSGMRVGN